MNTSRRDIPIMKRLLILALLLATTLSVCAQHNFYPFEVTVGERTAAVQPDIDQHAVITEPISADAAMSVKGQTGQVIVNLFPTDANGEVEPGGQPLILLFDAGDSKSLSDNMQGQKPRAGYHLANVVAGGATSRVLLQVR